VDFQGVSVEQVSKLLSLVLDRPVLDRTGILGLFDFRVEFDPDPATPMLYRGQSPEPATGESFMDAIEGQTGLRLERGRGPSEFLVIDHVERPSEN
jgi:uncharacterized protein (TIGR03435 family)